MTDQNETLQTCLSALTRRRKKLDDVLIAQSTTYSRRTIANLAGQVAGLDDALSLIRGAIADVAEEVDG